MPRKSPNCVYCGKPLGVVAYRWMSPTLPGKAEVGWHMFESGTCAVCAKPVASDE